jgi:predicted RNase H-like nuclease (RuvC/YqgF family)
MTKEEIIKLYLSDLKNLLPDSPAKRSRIVDLEEELERSESENERLKAEMFTLEDIERAFNAGVNSQFEVKALNKTDVLDFHTTRLHQLILSINPPKQ